MPKANTATEFLDHHESLHRKIVDKAISDRAFRAALEADPKRALAAELGVELPAEVSVRLLTESEREIVIVLPEATAPTEPEIQDLTDEDLRTAAALPIDCRISWYYTWSVYEPENP